MYIHVITYIPISNIPPPKLGDLGKVLTPRPRSVDGLGAFEIAEVS